MEGLIDIGNINKGLSVGTLRREARTRGMSLYKLANLAGIPLPSIYYYAKNPERMPLDKAEAIRKALNMTPDEWAAWFAERQNKK